MKFQFHFYARRRTHPVGLNIFWQSINNTHWEFKNTVFMVLLLDIFSLSCTLTSILRARMSNIYNTRPIHMNRYKNNALFKK